MVAVLVVDAERTCRVPAICSGLHCMSAFLELSSMSASCRGDPVGLLDKLCAQDHPFSQHPASRECYITLPGFLSSFLFKLFLFYCACPASPDSHSLHTSCMWHGQVFAACFYPLLFCSALAFLLVMTF